MRQIGVMHVVDALDVGGAERVAVNLVNLLPRDRYALHLCTTRHDGPLERLVRNDVSRLRLDRRWRFDLRAVARLSAYIRRHDIRLLHAHQSSLFIALAAAHLPPFPRVVWHDHFGVEGVERRSVAVYGPSARRAAAVISVSRPLADWARTRLRIPSDRVSYVPNFVVPDSNADQAPGLPGSAGSRIVCVANLRREKDHLTLVRAMAKVVTQVPSAQLLLVGQESDRAYAARVREEVSSLALDGSVSWLGCRRDVGAILRASDVGVLSSAAEGLPLALVEYGFARLATVATGVGECPEVLDNGRAGLLVQPGDVDGLAARLLSLLRAPDLRRELAAAFQAHVRRAFGPARALERITGIYIAVLQCPGSAASIAGCR